MKTILLLRSTFLPGLFMFAGLILAFAPVIFLFVVAALIGSRPLLFTEKHRSST
jgi:hypothetical protein